MHDLIIKNATIVDGTGSPARSGDVVADNGVITEVTTSGAAPVAARRVVDAGGELLTPGFVTDTVGFLLFLPPVRDAIRNWLGRRMQEGGQTRMWINGEEVSPDQGPFHRPGRDPRAGRRGRMCSTVALSPSI